MRKNISVGLVIKGFVTFKILSVTLSFGVSGIYSDDPARFYYDEKQAYRLFTTSISSTQNTVQSENLIENLEEIEEGDFNVLKSIGSADLKSVSYYPANSPSNLEDSIFAYVKNESGLTRLVKKSSIVWLLEHGERRLSNDRISRVMQTASFAERKKTIVQITGRQTVRLGDWCIFKNAEENNYYLGRVLGMAIIEGATNERSTIVEEWDEHNKKNTTNTGALCSWFEFEQHGRKLTGLLKESNGFTHGFHSFRYYICSCPPPHYVNSESRDLVLSQSVITMLSSLFEFL